MASDGQRVGEGAAIFGMGGGGGGDFKCRMCMRRFPSFQALGGHMTGHARLEARLRQQQEHGGGAVPAVRVTNRLATGQLWHPCAKCGQEFRVGQALGGHMRRHRAEEAAAAQAGEVVQPEPEMPNLDNPLVEVGEGEVAQVPRLLNLLV